MALPASSYIFLKSTMPRIMAQDIVTGKWQHRDIQGISSPMITNILNGVNTFTGSILVPRRDLMITPGVPLLQEWRTAIYVDEEGEIKFGGILTNSQMTGNQYDMTVSGFTTYPAGIPFSGTLSKTNYDAFDAVRDIWHFIQSHHHANLQFQLSKNKAGYQLGTGSQQVQVTSRNPKTHAVTFKNVTQAVPFRLDWWNSTDCGQEIQSIMQEIPAEWLEHHNWATAARDDVEHHLTLAAPRIGIKNNGLFVEGENVMLPPVVSRDGSKYANEIDGIGAGQGSKTTRASVSKFDGNLWRPATYTNQTIRTVARLRARVERTLAHSNHMDTITQVVVKDHAHAPFGSFGLGDDIYVQCTSGWRTGLKVWSRITQIQQDPTSNIITLTCQRSDSFSYITATGLAGSV